MMDRIDVSMTYTHLIWAYVFCIYVIAIGFYIITELRKKGRFEKDLSIVLDKYAKRIKKDGFKKNGI